MRKPRLGEIQNLPRFSSQVHDRAGTGAQISLTPGPCPCYRTAGVADPSRHTAPITGLRSPQGAGRCSYSLTQQELWQFRIYLRVGGQGEDREAPGETQLSPGPWRGRRVPWGVYSLVAAPLCPPLPQVPQYVASLCWEGGLSGTHPQASLPPHPPYRVQCLEALLRASAAQHGGRAGHGPEEPGPSEEADGPVRHAQQHRHLDGCCGRALEQQRPRGPAPRLPHRDPVQEAPRRRSVRTEAERRRPAAWRWACPRPSGAPASSC